MAVAQHQETLQIILKLASTESTQPHSMVIMGKIPRHIHNVKWKTTQATGNMDRTKQEQNS
jgi:hypothetical protein